VWHFDVRVLRRVLVELIRVDEHRRALATSVEARLIPGTVRSEHTDFVSNGRSRQLGNAIGSLLGKVSRS